MLIELADGTNVHVRFDHGQRRNKARRRERHPGRFTLCTVSITADNGGVATAYQGVAKANTRLDNFCRKTGRKIALGRAIERLPKGIRAEIWAQYFEHTREIDPNNVGA